MSSCARVSRHPVHVSLFSRAQVSLDPLRRWVVFMCAGESLFPTGAILPISCHDLRDIVWFYRWILGTKLQYLKGLCCHGHIPILKGNSWYSIPWWLMIILSTYTLFKKYTYLHVCICIYIYLFIHIYIYIYMYLFTNIYLYIYLYIYIYIYITLRILSMFHGKLRPPALIFRQPCFQISGWDVLRLAASLEKVKEAGSGVMSMCKIWWNQDQNHHKFGIFAPTYLNVFL